MKYKNTSSKENCAGVNNAAHILSMFVTAFGAVFLIIFINTLLFFRLKDSAGSAVSAFFSSFPFKFFVSFYPSVFICGVFVLILIAADIFIYRHVVKKIFEHISIIFLGAGGFTLLFMTGYKPDILYLLVSGLLLLAGAVLMLLYGLAYHRERCNA